MRRFKMIFAVLAMLAVMVATAAPAVANDNDGWWDNCDWVIVGWHWVPVFWGLDWDWSWALVCVPDDNWQSHDDWRGHGDWDDDDDDDDWWRHDGRW